MITIEHSYSDWKNEVDNKSIDHFYYMFRDSYMLIALDGPIIFTHKLDRDDKADYEDNYKPNANHKVGNYYSREPFASKILKNGMKLYRRKHGYKETIAANSSKDIIISVPYDNCKINKLEIIDANPLDRIDMMVLDTPTGTTSTIPNYMLNQFGFGVVVSELLYSDKSDYDADLIKDMQLKITYYNDSASSKEIGLNIIFHEVK